MREMYSGNAARSRHRRRVLALMVAAAGCVAILAAACGSSSVFGRRELSASNRAPGDDFGWSLALYGSTAVVGAPFKNSDTGVAYVFVRSRGKWSEQAKLTTSDAAAGDQFGWSVALSGSTAVVGAPGKNSKTGPRTCSCAPTASGHSRRS